MTTKTILFLLLTCSAYCDASAQQTALEYNNTIVHELNSVATSTAAYLNAATHGHNAADANAKLAILIKTLQSTKANVAAMTPYKGYTGLRDSIVNYLNIGCNAAVHFSGVLIEEDMIAMPYEKIKTYMEGSDVLNDKLTVYNTLVKREQKRFAEKNGFPIQEEQRPFDKKLQDAKQVLRYYHRVFLVFIKCNKQELLFIDTLNSENPKSLELIRGILQQYTEEALQRLDTFLAYNNDASLVKAGKEALQFFELEAKGKFPLIIDYFQKKEKFDKQSKALNNIPAKDRTDKMIDSYNANLKALNDAVVIYNKINQELNVKRIEVIDKYNKAISDFLDRNTPRM